MIITKSQIKWENFEPVATKVLRALLAPEFCKDMGHRKIVMEGDALQIVNVVKSSG